MKSLLSVVSGKITALAVLALISVASPAQKPVKQGPPVPPSFRIDSAVTFLYRKVNAYRSENQLPPVALSRSLCYVAMVHAKDLFLHHPDRGTCNFHSWSDKGSWTPFCYPADETKKNSVWDKPRELTRYPGKAYEIVYWENNPLVADTVFSVWRNEEYFNDFLLNQGKWLGRTWNAIGLAVFENYACAWFGELPDPDTDLPVKAAIPAKPAKPQTTPKPNPEPATRPVPPSVKPATVPDTIPVKPDSLLSTYYIVIKTNLKKDSAEKIAAGLRETGYPLAKVLDQDGKIRLSAFESPDKKVVMMQLREVKKVYKDAWLLKR
ncbi:MAG TPA: CAP domain-containing protein [Bacteroidales bacterium]|nr:CAP domain-containing protein [Bacteroidales bacterium]